MAKTKLPSFVTVLILTLITVVMWVSFDVYRLFVKPADPSVPEAVSAPLSPTLDQETMSTLQSGLFLDDSEIPDSVVGAFSSTTTSPSPTPEPEETIEELQSLEEASPSGSPNPEETATSSGQPV